MWEYTVQMSAMTHAHQQARVNSRLIKDKYTKTHAQLQGTVNKAHAQPSWEQEAVTAIQVAAWHGI